MANAGAPEHLSKAVSRWVGCSQKDDTRQSPFPRHRREFKFLIHSLASCYSQVLWNSARQMTSGSVTEVPNHPGIQRLSWTIQSHQAEASLKCSPATFLGTESGLFFSNSKSQRSAATQFLLIIFTYYKLILQFGNSYNQTQNRIRTSILKAGHYHYPGGYGEMEAVFLKGLSSPCQLKTFVV